MATGPSIQRGCGRGASGARLASNGALASAVGQPRSYLACPPAPRPTNSSPQPQCRSATWLACRSLRRAHPDLAAHHAAAQPDPITAATTGGREGAAPDLDATQKSLRPAAEGAEGEEQVSETEGHEAAQWSERLATLGVWCATRINLGLSPDARSTSYPRTLDRCNPRGRIRSPSSSQQGVGKTTLTVALVDVTQVYDRTCQTRIQALGNLADW